MKRDKVIVAVSSTARPNGFVDEAGKLTGFEVEFARLMAKALVGDANKVELMTTTVDGRFPAVLSGRADFGISTATIYPDRAVRLAFTRPYIDSSTLVVVPKASPIKTLADLDNANVVFGSTNSAAMVDRAKRYAPKAQAVFFDTDSAAALALKSGRSAAWQADSAAANYFVGQNQADFRLLEGSLGTINNNAIFMKPGDFQLWLALDTIVREYVNGSRYGEYQALYKTWFGKDAPPQRPFNQN
ncbi:substrate-binding periplasmic protein [Bosea beijingensis]|uniref:substrate-binding periplasmic protein n=1 Tax=Bosea beijingensis TaxID=3068632 RepID=UPI00274226D3|nr:transporter substrate-binding domain-containing protein [Bosea sp. REN20]